MKVIAREDYDLLLSHDCCEIFRHYNVLEMHGLNIADCTASKNTRDTAYIAGWCNIIPNSDRHFVFINLSRCNNIIDTFGLIMHELMHMGFRLFADEEMIVTWAEVESKEVYKIIQDAVINSE